MEEDHHQRRSSNNGTGLRILVTVGSTTFAPLIERMLSPGIQEVVPNNATLNIQYGQTPLHDILLSLASEIDTSSAKTVQPGLHKTSTDNYTWRGSDLHHLDPGYTGTISSAWQIQSSSDDNDDDNQSTFTSSSGSNGSLKLRLPDRNITVNLFNYLPTLKSHIQSSDIVISHAGSGSLLDTLRIPNPPLLILVPNATLLDNHQIELAEAVQQGKWAKKADLDELPRVLKRVIDGEERPVAFPQAQPERFRRIVDEMLGL
ncbi:unnamed protein product [Sympodiomycopsis kandeliae]